jgi:hypothetical protein
MEGLGVRKSLHCELYATYSSVEKSPEAGFTVQAASNGPPGNRCPDGNAESGLQVRCGVGSPT